MSVSTDAILFYGFALGEGDVAFRTWLGWYNGPYENYEKVDEEEANHSCNVGCYCSDRCTMYYVAAIEHRVYRGDVGEVNSLDVMPSDAERLKVFCEAVGIEYQKPRWLLVSWRG